MENIRNISKHQDKGVANAIIEFDIKHYKTKAKQTNLIKKQQKPYNNIDFS